MAAATPEEMANWPAPNYVDPENRQGIVLGLTAPTLALVIIFTGARFYGKGVLRHALGLDDWMMLVATIFSIPVSAMALVSLNYGLGLHMWDQKNEWHEPYNKMAFAVDILFPISCSVTKISLCLTYLRLFPSKADKIFCYFISGFVTLYTVACIFLMLFQCTPIRGYWDKDAVQHCIDMRATLICVAALNSVSDFLVYLWPAKPLWILQLPLKQRLGLIFIFGIGCTVCVAGSLRMYYLEVYFESYDLLWEASPVYSIIALEMNLGIICGCLSGVKPVLAVVFPRLFASTSKTKSRPAGSTYGRTGTNTQSFAFQPDPDASNLRNTTRDRKLENGFGIEAMAPEGMESTNFAWASSSGERNRDAEMAVPLGAIQVNQVVTVKGEAKSELRDGGGSGSGKGSVKSGKGDRGSEEWIMEEFPQPDGKQ